MTPLSSTDFITCPIRENVLTRPDAIAILSGEYQLTYRQLDKQVASVASSLQDKGIKEGEIVALCLEPSAEFVTLIFALFRVKGIAAPVNTRLPNAAIPDMLKRINCSVIIGNDRRQGSSLFPGFTYYNAAEFGGDQKASSDLGRVEMDASQRATIIFSSGSTGLPKAVLHSFANHHYNALGSNQNIAVQPGDRWLLSLPLYHVAGIAILFRSFIAGSTVVIPNRKRSIEIDLRIEGVSHASLVSTQLQQVLYAMSLGDNFPGLKAILVGGSAVRQSIRNEAFAARLPVFFSYGLSEMSSQVTTTSPKASEQEILTSGSLLPFRTLKIAPDGEILVKGNTLFLGYLVGEEVNGPVDENGWFPTGDIGTISDEGYLTVLGRKDNMFISGGENIYPEQIEKVIQSHPQVRQAMVVPIPDEKFGYRPVAFVDSDEINPLHEVIEAFLEYKLPRYMYPVLYIDWEKAPERMGIKDSRREFAAKAVQIITERN